MIKKWSYYFSEFTILKYDKNIIPVINSYLNIDHLNLYDKLFYHKTAVTFFDFFMVWLKGKLRKLILFVKNNQSYLKLNPCIRATPYIFSKK